MTGGYWESVIRFGTYNISNRRNEGLELALRGMDQANIRLGVFQETKFMDEVHTCASTGYRFFATNVLIGNSGEVALFYRDDAPNFQVKVMQRHGPNMMCFRVASGGRRWFIFGYYLSPKDAATIKCAANAIRQRPCRAVLLVAGYFNTYLETPEGRNRKEDIEASITTAVL